MADCTCYPPYLLLASELSLSDKLFEENAQDLLTLTPNPFLEGRDREKKSLRDSYNTHAKRLVWC